MKKKILKVSTIIAIITLITMNNSMHSLATEYVDCGGSAFPKLAVDLSHIIIQLLKLITPIAIIILGSLDYTKSVANVSEIANNRKKFLHRIFAGFMVFFIVSIVQMVVSAVADNQDTNSCINCFVNGSTKCTSKSSPNVPDYPESNKKFNADDGFVQPKLREDAYQDKDPGNLKYNSGNSNPGTTTPSTPGSKTIIAGDSRTVGMCGNKGASYSCDTGKNEGYISCGSAISIACGSKGLAWFKKTGVPAIKSNLGSSRSNIVIWLGINDIFNLKEYIKEYKNLAQGDFKNHNVIIVTITDIKHDGKWANRKEISSFNKSMTSAISSANISNLYICDAANGISFDEKDFQSGDYIHYNAKGSQKVLDYINSKCLK